MLFAESVFLLSFSSRTTLNIKGSCNGYIIFLSSLRSHQNKSVLPIVVHVFSHEAIYIIYYALIIEIAADKNKNFDSSSTTLLFAQSDAL